MMDKKSGSVGKLSIVCFLLLAFTALVPFIYMVLVSLTEKTILDFKFDVREFTAENYYKIYRNFNIVRNFTNSMIVTVSACFFNCAISSAAAYAFAKKRFPLKNALFPVYIATLMIPSQITLVPVFLVVRKLGLMNTYAAMVLPILNAFGVFLVRQFMNSFPDELLEAASIDGSGEHRTFAAIVIPLIKPVLVSLIIFTFITAWNDFLWPLVIASKPKVQTLTLVLATLKGNYATNYGLVMAGTTVAFLPPFVIYMLFQREFVEGIALSGVKG